MIGLAALAFASCAKHDFETMTQEQIVKAEYDAKFVAQFGQPASNHTWGFGSTTRAFTRAAEPRANEWAATYKVPEPLSEGQMNRVKKYFQYHHNPGGTTMNISNYFVQQVYKGGTDPLGDGSNGYSTEVYLAANQETYITGGSNMDKLTAGTQHEHVNNFNNGDCGINYNVLDNNQPINGGSTHEDKIMLMLNTPTTCMGYWNSNGSYGHDDRYRLVSAQTIDNWAKDNPDKLDAVDAAVVDDWNRDFVGFDFSQVPSDKILVKTNEQYEDGVLVDYDLVCATINDGPKGYDYIWDGTQTIKITDENRAQYLYITDNYGNQIPFLDNKRNEYCGYERKKDKGDFSEAAEYSASGDNNNSIELTNVPYTRTLENGNTQTENVTALNIKFIRKMVADGYYPIQENFRTWISPRDCADGYYTDWIVSLVAAQPKDTETEEFPAFEGRIMAEDLTVATNSDWDFNDVVFDWAIKDGKAYIELLAAGGTLPIRIGGFRSDNTSEPVGSIEIHSAQGLGGYMKNCGVGDEVPSKKLVLVAPEGYTYDTAKNILITVQKGGNWVEIEADQGEPAAKFNCKVGTKWCDEYVNITRVYDDFTTWVANPSVDWTNLVPEKARLVDGDLENNEEIVAE